MSGELLAVVRILFGLNPEENCRCLLGCMAPVFTTFLSSRSNANEVTNLILVLSELETSETYVHNIFKEDTTEEAQRGLGKLAADTFKFAELCKRTEGCPYLDMAVLLFAEKVLYETVQGVNAVSASANGNGSGPKAVVVTTSCRMYNCMGLTESGQSMHQFLGFAFTMLYGWPNVGWST